MPMARIYPDNFQVHPQLGSSRRQLRRQALIAAQQGNHDRAIHLLNRLISHPLVHAIDYNNRGLVYFQAGYLDRAIADYNMALELDPHLDSAYNNRANYYATQGQLGAAVQDYDQAINLNPSNIRARLNQGITYRELARYEQALESFDLALQLYPLLKKSFRVVKQYLEGHLHAERGRTLQLYGDWNQAVADYRTALAKLPQTVSDLDNTPELALEYRLYRQVQRWLVQLLCTSTQQA
jgi:tetratricopeptide (TPR) repeat protein